MDKQAWSQLLDKLKNHQITDLELNHELFQEPCILQLSEFCHYLRGCQSLKRFTLRDCCYPRMIYPPITAFNAILTAIADNPQVRCVLLPHNNLQAIFASSKCALFKCVVKLQEIDLADNNLQKLAPNEITELYQTLAASNQLIIVNLSDNALEHVTAAMPYKLKQCCAQHAEIQDLFKQMQSQLNKAEVDIADCQAEIENDFVKILTVSVEKTTQRLRYLLRPSIADLIYAQYYFITSQTNKTDADKDLVCALKHLVSITPTDPVFKQATILFNKLNERVRLKKAWPFTQEMLALFKPCHIFYSEILQTLGHIQLDNITTLKEQRLANALAFFTAAPNTGNPEKLIVALFHELMGKTGIPSLNTWQDLYQLDAEAYKTACQKIRCQQIGYGLDTAEAVYFAPIKAAQENLCSSQSRALKV